ncbi:hypothetical protein, partial [Bacillus sp. JJ722]|uniref:hypothetical protein n=1 Tax=Bacillus sp. JJ722 TaxID=3122973 RepID=UPI002FFFACC7
DSSIITFCVSEEYAPNITSVDDEKNTFSPEVAPYLNTFYSLDLQEKRMLIHHRNYPPSNLEKQINMVRAGLLLEGAFQEIYNSPFNYINTSREFDDEDFLRVFNNNRITLLRVKLYNTGRRIIDGTQIFEDTNLNDYWIQGFDSDSSDTYEITLKAPGKNGEGDLRNSPIAKSLINMVTKDILELNYWEDNESNKMSRSDVQRFRIRGINKDTDPITAIETIKSEVYRRRAEVRRFRAIEEMV